MTEKEEQMIDEIILTNNIVFDNKTKDIVRSYMLKAIQKAKDEERERIMKLIYKISLKGDMETFDEDDYYFQSALNQLSHEINKTNESV